MEGGGVAGGDAGGGDYGPPIRVSGQPMLQRNVDVGKEKLALLLWAPGRAQNVWGGSGRSRPMGRSPQAV